MASGLLCSVTNSSVFSGFVVPGGTNQDSDTAEPSSPSVTVISTGQVSRGISQPEEHKQNDNIFADKTLCHCRNARMFQGNVVDYVAVTKKFKHFLNVKLILYLSCKVKWDRNYCLVLTVVCIGCVLDPHNELLCSDISHLMLWSSHICCNRNLFINDQH